MKNNNRVILSLMVLFSSSLSLIAQAPGGVSSGLVAWYKQNPSNSSTVWKDRYSATKDALGQWGPTYETTNDASKESRMINFNEAVNFHRYLGGTIFTVPTTAQVGGTATSAYTVITTGRLRVNGWESDNDNTNREAGQLYCDNSDNIRFGQVSSTNGVAWRGSDNVLVVYSGGSVGTVELKGTSGSVMELGANAYLHTYVMQRQSTGAISLRNNGVQTQSATNSAPHFLRLRIGGISGRYTNAKVPEILIYNTALSTTAGGEMDRVESYLAMKYANALSKDYYDSQGNKIWDATINSIYKNNLIVIGKDSGSELEQTISQSEMDYGMRPILKLGTSVLSATNYTNTQNIAAGNSISNDRSFLFMGDNNNIGISLHTTDGANITTRHNQIWKVSNVNGFTATNGVQLLIDRDAWGNRSDKAYILVRSDENFALGSSTIIAPETTTQILNGNTYYVFTLTNAQVASDFYYTLANVSAPGGVPDLVAWYRGDYMNFGAMGEKKSNWPDITGRNYDLRMGNTNYQGTLNFAPETNFNKSISLDGNDYYYYIDKEMVQGGDFFGRGGYNSITTSGMSIFTAATKGSGTVCGFGDDNPNLVVAGNNAQIWRNWGTLLTDSYIDSGVNIMGLGMHPGLSGVGSSTTGQGENRTMVNGVLGSVNQTGNTTGGFNNDDYQTGFAIGTEMDDNFGDFNTRGEYYNAPVAEVMIYKKNIMKDASQGNKSDYDKINSYMALKYGITLKNPTTFDYKASDGTVFWNGTTNLAYHNRVFGVGRDDVSGLEQQISKAQGYAISPLTVSLDNNFTLPNGEHAKIDKNLTFLMFGDDNGALGFTRPASTTTFIGSDGTLFASSNNLVLSRIWKTQDVGGNKCVNLRFNTLNISGGSTYYYLLLSDNPNFTNVIYKQVFKSGSNIDASVNFANNGYSYFTLATSPTLIKDTPSTGKIVGMSTIPDWVPTANNTFLELNSNSNGFVITRVKNNTEILNPIKGMFIYNLETNKFQIYNGTNWRDLGISTNDGPSFCN